MSLTAAQVNQAFAGILRRAPTLAEGIGYASEPSMAALIGLLLSLAENTGGVTPIIRLYTGIFNRTPDSAGLDFWVQNYHTYAAANGGYNQANEVAACALMFTSSEYIADYPSTMTTTQYVTAVYTNIFRRAPDAPGLAFWVDLIDNHGYSKLAMIVQFTESTEYLGDTGAGITAFQTDCANAVSTAYSDIIW